MKKARACAYYVNEEPEAETEEESDDGSVKPGSPITTLDWHF